MEKFFTIVIPCLNEKETILQSIADAFEHGSKYLKNQFEIVVADNGSTDGTLELLKNQKNARVVHVPIRGYGAALHWGILSAKGDYVLFADADLSYPFLNLPKYVEAVNARPDLILGSRIKGNIEQGAMPFLNRHLGTPVLTFLIRNYYKIPTSDCNSGMRMVRKDFYQTLNMRNSGMEWASELLLKTALKKGKYVEFPIEFHKDRRNKAPHLARWADGWRHLKTILLLKPSIVYPFLVLFPVLAILLYSQAFAFAFLLLLMTLSFLLVLGANSLLRASLDGHVSFVAKILTQFTVVKLAIVIESCLIGMMLFTPEVHLGTKLFLASLVNIVFMWIFLIETIKTRVSNRLPDQIEY